MGWYNQRRLKPETLDFGIHLYYWLCYLGLHVLPEQINPIFCILNEHSPHERKPVLCSINQLNVGIICHLPIKPHNCTQDNASPPITEFIFLVLVSIMVAGNSSDRKKSTNFFSIIQCKRLNIFRLIMLIRLRNLFFLF